MATPVEGRMKALDMMNDLPGTTPIGSTISAMRTAQQKAEKAGKPLDMGELAQQATQQAGQKVLQENQQQAQMNLTLQGQALAGQQQETEQDLANREMALKDSVQSQEMALKQLSSRLAQELHDDTTAFKRDEIGRAYLNERQLSDYAVLQAKSQEELQGFIQIQGQLHEQRTQLLKAAYQKIEVALKQLTDSQMSNERLQYDAEQQRQTQKAQEYLAQAKKELEAKIAQEQRKSAQVAAGWGVLGSVVQGTVLGAATGNPVMAAAGAVGGLATGVLGYLAKT